MKVTLNWLREFVEIELPLNQLADRLAMSGFEVEEISDQGATPITIAQITQVTPHPNADHLVVCHVTTGGESFPVVCGATNMKYGDKVALAPAGSTLLDGRRVERTEIRGQVSHGTLCSEQELGLSSDHSGLLLLSPDAPLGISLYSFLGLRDTIIDIAVTANRGDCLSILGLAREIAALTGARFHPKTLRLRETGALIEQQTRIRIDDPDLCPRYAARVFEHVRVAPSPAWMRWRLEAVGLRSINNLVDITNYVMIERGQPLHAFDLPSLAGAEIIVRRARATETIRTLDEQERSLVPEDLLICDRDHGVAIAGVMGGANSEVRSTTTTVLLESAYFIPETVRRTARRLGMRSEASYRFERGIDPQGTVLALNRAAVLIAQLASGKISQGVIDVYPRPFQPAEIPLRSQRVNTFLGVSIEQSEIKRSLKTLGMRVKRRGRTAWYVTSPPYRSDIAQEADLIEEIARLRGYDKIPTLLPRIEGQEKKSTLEETLGKRIRAILATQGLAEMLNMSFTSSRLNTFFPGLFTQAAPIILLNPLSQEDVEMRLSLLSNLLRALQLNLRQGETQITTFEFGKVFHTKNGASLTERQEHLCVAGVLYGKWPASEIGREGARIDFLDLKGILETLYQELHYSAPVQWLRAVEIPFLHPGKAAMLSIDSSVLGVAGALHPAHCAQLELDETPWVFELDVAALARFARPVSPYQSLPRFPAVVRDIAIIAKEDLPAQAVVDAIRSLGNPLITETHLFDLYHGAPIPAQKKSLAYSISYRAPDRTLTTQEVNTLHTQVIEHIVRTLGVEIRA
ncbi:MAG: phenylalanine--tRNA ligase subunit beta [Candidatus Binatia bacterium]